MVLADRHDEKIFLAQLEKQYAQIKSDSPLDSFRRAAWDHFAALGLPSRQVETYRYIKLSRLYAQSFLPSEPSAIEPEKISPFILPECKQSVLVFVNGHFQPNLSNTGALPAQLVVVPLSKAVHTYGAYLNNQWAQTIKDETDPFAAMNAALGRDGAFLYLPPKTIVTVPVQLLFVVDVHEAPMLMLPYIHIFVGAQSQIEFISTQAKLSGAGFFANHYTEWVVEEGAQVRIIQIKMDSSEKEWAFNAVRSTLKRDSSFQSISLTNGAATDRNDYRVILAGENAEALLNGIWMMRDNREAHTHIHMDHRVPNCRSKQVFKGVLDDFSRSSFSGKILIRPEAQKSNAFQYNHNLLLSDEAHAVSKPALEIFADDVKASHGATVGQLDKEQLFFLKTRGFSEEEARRLLIQGFCRELVDLIKTPSVKEKYWGQLWDK